jgi:Mitogen-activated protein kinase kinase 1 interacting
LYSSSYDKAKHIVEVDEKIMAVFIVDSEGNVSHLFIAHDADIDSSMVESVRSALNLRFERNQEQQQKANTLLGKHLWDISEYDKLKVIKIYESDLLIVVLAKSHTSSPGDVAETVIGYLYESEEQQPKSLF